MSSTIIVHSGESIQAAITAAAPGDTIVIEAGVYAGNVTVNKPLTILGAHSGVDGSDASRDLTGGVGESTLSGLLHIGGAGNGVVVDGLRILDGAHTGATGSDTPGIFVQSSDVVITNSVFFRAGTVDSDQSRGIMTSSGANGILVTDNVMTGWHTGVYVNGGQTTEGVTVTDNTFEGNLVGLSMDAFPSGQPITVTDNEFIDNLLEGIGVGSGAGGATWNPASDVSGNTFDGAGIFIWGPAQPAIFGGNSFIVNAGDSIQAAINAAQDGDTILIAAGTYQEQLTIDGKDITLSGAGQGQTIILSPDAANLTVNVVDSSRGLPNQYSVIGIKNDADVTIRGLTIDGNDQGAAANGGGQFTGIYALNSDVVVDDVHVTKVDELAGQAASGNQRNHAIVADSQPAAGEHTITVQNSLIDLFQKTGIFVLGPTLTANLHDNQIVGAGPGVQAQNGIQIGSSGAGAGTDATVTDNAITGLGVTGNPANGVGTGVLTFNGGASVSVTHNTITGTDNPSYGVVFVNTEAPAANGNTISSTTAGLVDSGNFTTPLVHAGNVYSGNDYNVALEASGSANLTFSGSEGPDSLQGGSGVDTLSGLGGDDTIDGGAGNDIATGYSASATISIDNSGHWMVTDGADTRPSRRRSMTRWTATPSWSPQEPMAVLPSTWRV